MSVTSFPWETVCHEQLCPESFPQWSSGGSVLGSVLSMGCNSSGTGWKRMGLPWGQRSCQKSCSSRSCSVLQSISTMVLHDQRGTACVTMESSWCALASLLLLSPLLPPLSQLLPSIFYLFLICYPRGAAQGLSLGQWQIHHRALSDMGTPFGVFSEVTPAAPLKQNLAT